MKRIATALVFVLSPIALSAGEPVPETAWVEQSRQLATQLGSQLKGELSKAIAAGGPMAAINVCYLRAPEIAAQLSKESGARVGRTSLRVRNPSNAPDELERAVLEQFATDLGSGPIDRPLEAVFEIRRGCGRGRATLHAPLTPIAGTPREAPLPRPGPPPRPQPVRPLPPNLSKAARRMRATTCRFDFQTEGSFHPFSRITHLVK